MKWLLRPLCWITEHQPLCGAIKGIGMISASGECLRCGKALPIMVVDEYGLWTPIDKMKRIPS